MVRPSFPGRCDLSPSLHFVLGCYELCTWLESLLVFVFSSAWKDGQGSQGVSVGCDGGGVVVCAALLVALPRGCGQREHELRDVFDAVRYAARSGCAWRMIPCSPHPRAVHGRAMMEPSGAKDQRSTLRSTRWATCWLSPSSRPTRVTVIRLRPWPNRFSRSPAIR